MIDKVTLDQASTEDGGLHMDTAETPAVQVDDDVARSRGRKAVQGVPQLEMTADQAYEQIKAGKEADLREQASMAVDRQKSLILGDVITQVAKDSKGPLNPYQLEHVKTTVKSLMAPTDTFSVFEEYFSKDYLEHIARTGDLNPDGMIAEARKTVPEQVQATNGKVLDYQIKNELIRTQFENSKKLYDEQGWGAWTVDQLWGLVPLRQRYRLLGVTPETTSLTPELIDSALETQAINMLQLNTPEFKEAFLKRMDELSDDRTLQLKFVESLKGRSTNQQYLGNFFEALDLQMAGSLVKGVAKTGINTTRALVTAKQYNKAAKDLIEAVNKVDASEAVAKEALGDTENAAVVKVADDVLKDLHGQGQPVQKAEDQLMSGLKSDASGERQAPGRLGREFSTRIANRTELFAEKVVKTIKDLVRIQNIPEALASRIALNEIKEDVKSLFTGVKNAVLDISEPIPDKLGNTWSFDVKIGTPEAKLFPNQRQAELFAKDHGLVDAVVSSSKDPGGEGFFLKVNKPLDQTTDTIRKTFLETINKKDPDTFWAIMKSSMSYLGGADESLAAVHRMNRKLAAYGTSVITKMLKEEGHEISNLARGVITKDPVTGEAADRLFNRRLGSDSTKKRFDDWERVVKYAREMEDKSTGLPGYFAASTKELDDIYMDIVGRFPDHIEARAYFAYKRIVEADRMMRNISVYRDKTNRGFQQFQVYTHDEAGNKYNSGFFEAKKIDHYPGGDFTMLRVGDKVGDETIVDLADLSKAAQRKSDVLAVTDGKKIVLEIENADARPLKLFGSPDSTISRTARPKYILVDTGKHDVKSLSWEQVPRRGGGHFEYDYEYYIKQAKVFPERVGKRFNYWYQGDTTIMPVEIRAMGQEFVKHLNEVRKLIGTRNIDEARAYSQQHLHVDFDKIHGWFKDSRKDGKFVPARLSLDEPIQLIRRDQTVGSTDNSLKSRLESKKDHVTFRDATKESPNSQVAFTGERDAFNMETIVDKGSRYNPLYAFEPTKLVDPMPSINRSVSKMAKSLFMDDYKAYSVQRWLQDASQFIKVQGNLQGAIRSMPFYYFHHPEYTEGTPLATKIRLEADRQKIMQFTGQASQVDKFMFGVAQSLIDTSYMKLGPGRIREGKYFDKVGVTPVAEWLLPKLTDPTDFIRGVVFHKTLGLFNVAQTLVQANTFANILGVAGYQHASSGTMAAFMTQLSRVNKHPDIIKRLDDMLVNHNYLPGSKKWKPGEFTESLKAAEDIGYFNVQGEHTLRNASVSSMLLQSAFSDVLNVGAIFFKEGERAVRMGAWHTAYREFRTKNPLGRLTDLDKGAILNRADELSLNMSRASNGVMQKGLFSIPMQFYTYQQRVMEQFTSNRLSPAVKARAMLTYGALYGMPTMTSLWGIPLADYIRSYALSEGYQPGDDWVKSFAMEGGISTLIAGVTGLAKWDAKKAVWYNVPERYGIQGLEVIRDNMRSDAGIIKSLSGAAGTTWTEGMNALDPFWQFAKSYVDPADQQMPVTNNDIIQALKVPSGGNNAIKMITAINSGNIYSKKGDLTEQGISVPDAIFQYLTGLSHQKQSDQNLFTWDKQSQTKYDKDTLQHYIHEMEAAITAGEEKDGADNAKVHFDKARNILRLRNYPEDMRAAAFSQAIQGKEPMVDRIVRNYYLKNVPAGKEDKRLDAFQRYLEKRPY